MIISKLELNKNWALALQLATIILFAIVPLFFSLPFRDNIYLTWEGAYRMYNGQMPFKDFGLPLGYAFWLIPALSFKLFGPYMFSLIKIQVLFNLVSALAFRSIIKEFVKDHGMITIGIILYVISYSFFNYWPWYNHTVIVFEFIGFAFLFVALRKTKIKAIVLFSTLSALFAFLSIFTKQDGGAFALLISLTLLLYYSIVSRSIIHLGSFVISYLLIATLFIAPLIPHEFGYWFNYGQEPHYSRISSFDILSTVFGASLFLKFYFFLIVIIILNKSREGLNWLLKDINQGLHLLLTLLILFQASILQVTSYVPADGNIYFHSFMVMYIINNLGFKISYTKVVNLGIIAILILIWWSGVYWKYSTRLFSSILQPDTTEDVVSISTYTLARDTMQLDKSTWRVPSYKAFNKIKLPPETIEGIDKLVKWKESQEGDVKILNMSELTPLAHILDFVPEKGTPLWYHYNVAFFDRELKQMNEKIDSKYYDLVVFEVIPELNNFYPFAVREKLKKEYELIDTFLAPREMKSEIIEVYVKKSPQAINSDE